MGILEVRLRDGRRVATIMLLFRDGRLQGESFSAGDIREVVGYGGVRFRVDVEGEERRLLTSKVEMRGGYAVFQDQSGEVHAVPLKRLAGLVAQE